MFFAMIFLVSSTGIIVFESHCSCSGNESVSFYVTPETCENNFHVHHAYDLAGNEIETEENVCHECSSHIHDCGCSTPDVKYIKLVNQLIDEELKFVHVQNTNIIIVEFDINFLFSTYNFENQSEEFYIDPPPQIKSSTNFLVQIHQLKIPDLA